MFSHLTNLSYQRTRLEAIGFYIAYLVFVMLASALAGALLVILLGINSQDAYNFGLRTGNAIAVVVTMGLSLLILKAKGLLNHFGLILLALCSGLIAAFIGSLGGLILAAYLTTRGQKWNEPKK